MLEQAASNANQNARAPSAILGAVAVTQLQFLGTLSLVDNTGGEDSSLPGFTDSFRYYSWDTGAILRGRGPSSRITIPDDEVETSRTRLQLTPRFRELWCGVSTDKQIRRLGMVRSMACV